MKILKRIGLFAVAILMAVGAVFLPKTLKSANADTTTQTGLQFLGNNILMSRLGMSVNDPGTNFDFSVFVDNNRRYNDWYSFSFKLSLDNEYPSRIHFGFSAVNNVPYPTIVSNYYDLGWLTYYSVDETINGYLSNVKYSEALFVDTGTGYNGYTRLVFALTGGNYSFDDPSSAPTLVMKSIEIGNSYDFERFTDLQFDYDRFSNANIVSYVDTNDFRYTFFIPTWTTEGQQEINGFDSNLYSYRKYYLSVPQLDNQEAYDDGYVKGKTDGYNTGYTSGYSEGSVTGYDNGYETGKLDGILSSNNYTFFGLITAVIDAPVRILTSLFNFNFLGINLWLFITSLLTISLVVVVLRKFMGKG